MKYLPLLLLVSGCAWISDTANSIGSHMPVIGERCEHWQCITSTGQEKSERNKTRQEMPKPQAETN